MCINTTTKKLEGVMLFFEKYKNGGFESSMNIVKSLAFDMNIEPILPTKYCVFRKKQFDENNHDEEIQSAKESFKINYFLVVVDMTISYRILLTVDVSDCSIRRKKFFKVKITEILLEVVNVTRKIE